MKILKRSMTLLLAASVLLTGCAQTVRLNTEPEGADIYVNNIYVGKSPTTYRARSGTPDTAYVRIEKPGYVAVRNATIDKTYRADISLLWLIPGIIPYFIAGAQYENDYLFALKRK